MASAIDLSSLPSPVPTAITRVTTSPQRPTATAPTLAPPASDIVCIFEPELDQKYQCPICLGVLVKPVQTSCGHRFCKHCFKRAVRTQPLASPRRPALPVCPVDKTNVDSVFEDVAVTREIQNINVICRQRERGCQWTGDYRDVETHIQDCEFEPVQCRLKCQTIVLLKDMDSHIDYCPKRLEPCKLCGKVILPWDLKHLFFECPNMPIPCIYCEKRYRRENIALHTDPLRGDCPGQEVSCRYQNLGCTIKCQRKDLSGHNELYKTEHMLLMLQRIEGLESKVLMLEATVSNTPNANGENVD